MSKKTTIKPVAAAIGTAFVLGVAATPASADTSPFGMTDLSSGYQQVAEGKCGGKKGAEGKCGEGKKAEKEGKCGEGKCGGAKEMEKNMEGKCGGSKAKKEGKCGEGKCGESK